MSPNLSIASGVESRRPQPSDGAPVARPRHIQRGDLASWDDVESGAGGHGYGATREAKTKLSRLGRVPCGDPPMLSISLRRRRIRTALRIRASLW
jgi:hypothetical protein